MSKGKIQAAQGQIDTLLSNAELAADQRATLEAVRANLVTPLQTDVWIYRTVVVVLGVTVLMTVAGGIYLEYFGRGDDAVALPQGVVSIGSAAIGALAGLLAPSPGSD